MGLRAFTNIKSITENTGNNKKEFYHYPTLEGSEEGMAEALQFMYAQSTSKKLKAFINVMPFMQKMQKHIKK
jgi:hypothetical protein